MKAWLEDKNIYLFDLAHDNLDNRAIVRGFIKHYILEGKEISHVQQDLHFHTIYGDYYMQTAMDALQNAMEEEANRED